jgi:hypothetical protein
MKRLEAQAFIAPSVLALAGSGGGEGHDVEVWDLLVAPAQAVVRKFVTEEGGSVKSLVYLSHKQWVSGVGGGGDGAGLCVMPVLDSHLLLPVFPDVVRDEQGQR